MEEDQESHPQKGHQEGSRKKICIKFKVITTTIEEAHHHNKNKIKKNEHDLDLSVCCLCQKSFGSCKALAGHMRVHSLATKKQLVCDAKQGTTKDSEESSRLSDTLLKGWSVSSKRGRKGVSFCEKSGSVGVNFEHDIDDETEMQEAANELMLLATGFAIECEDFSKISGINKLKRLKIQEKKLSSPEEGFATVSDSQASNGSIVGIKKKKGIKKMKLTELRTVEEKKKKKKDSNNIQKVVVVLKEEHQDSVVVHESHENGDENYCPKILSFDLNEVPAMDEEEGGVTVQSELVMASSSSSSYASSQSSVTHW
ncbi:hypothetical protein PIB30_029395 [Stylosanthes scabra]|uniref:C2H2-type domain-containing protein n=1 Tax=Stylosanthes scabra TaxID=79078 RepID=A0ABU6UA34_9FABA|nr:hypothetical protein [Stylosanthes scabra]